MVVFAIPNVKLRRAMDFLGLLTQDCLMHSTFSSEVLGRPGDVPFDPFPVSLNCFIHRFNALPSEAFLRNVTCTQQKFGWPNKVFRLNMGQWKFLLIQQNIFLGVCAAHK